MENKELLDNFEKTLQMGLMRVCSGAGLLGDELLSSEDIDSKWEGLCRGCSGELQ